MTSQQDDQTQQTTTGQLHIFFGSAPGVGKTWAMVDAAQEKRAAGLDVVVGLVDTHDRPEFAALLNGLEVIPLREVAYQGVLLRELDLNAIIRRKPKLVLIDDLPHTNAPGTRNAKRYQDVLELLQAGINVFTTLNVQHVSSVAAAVEEITGIPVREQVPDFVLEMATSIRLIDLEPNELLQRLSKRLKAQRIVANGGSFLPKDDSAVFNKRDNLLMLRELAMRVAASRLDDDVHHLVESDHFVDPWAGSSKIMVGISASPANERLLRATRRLVGELHTTWLAVYVEQQSDANLDEAIRQRIHAHLQLAKELGAETLTVAGQNVAVKLVEIAEQYGVSRVVVGRTYRKRGMLWTKPSLADQIMELSDNLDILILR
ncbi:MAG: hypothetical protein KF716_08270 [Anaerolineae bacterium]|nr:hypothetical protein [Anaerolineae bacterium]